MEYVCRVGTPSGEVVERTFSASDERALRTDLEQQGYYLLGIRRGLGISRLRLRPRRVNPTLLLVFAQELAALLKAGLPLFQSLDVMLERQRDPVFRQSLDTVREKVKSGVALSRCLSAGGRASTRRSSPPAWWPGSGRAAWTACCGGSPSTCASTSP